MHLKNGCVPICALSILSLIVRSAPAQETAAKSTAATTRALPASAQKTALSKAKPTVHFFGLYRLRIEDWNWFPTPKANGAYTFATSVLRFGAVSTTRTTDFTLEFEQPTLINIPHDASAPNPIGNLGAGANYYAANQNQSADFFIKQAFVRSKRLGNNPDASLQIGRFLFSDGAETAPVDLTIAYLKQTRINDRLISETFNSSLGRSFDGFRFSDDARLRNVTAFFTSPTRGVYSLDGWDTLTDIQIGYLAATFTQTGPHDASEGRIFAIYYGDEREQVVKVDNRPAAVRAADAQGIHMGVFGGNYVRSFALGPGRLDTVLWGAGEIGSWGHLSQAAYAYDTELGYQFMHAAWRPWLRLYYSFFGGDSAPGDTVHGTYMPLLTTGLKFAPFPFYTQMNLQDFCGQVIVHPNRRLSVRAEIHGLKLAQSQDLWYTGSGAYELLNFGYSGRPSGGRLNMGTLYDLTFDYNPCSNLTVSLLLGYAHGGDVEAATFPGRDADYSYLQFLYRF